MCSNPAVCQTFTVLILILSTLCFKKCSYINLPLFLLLFNFFELLQVSLGHLNHIACFLLRDHQGRGEGPRPTIEGGACGGSGQALPQIFTHSLAFEKFSSEESHVKFKFFFHLWMFIFCKA